MHKMVFFFYKGVIKCQFVNDDEKDKMRRLEEKINEMNQTDFSFNKSDLVATKALRIPPDSVNMVCEAV
jgi:hypothetical protein